MRSCHIPLLALQWSLPVAMMFTAPVSVFGQTWQTTGAPSNSWYRLCCSADGKQLVSLCSGGIYRSTNSASTWFLTGAPEEPWTSVACSADGARLVASAAVIYSSLRGGEHGGPIYVSADSGATWQLTTAPSNQWSRVTCSADGATIVAAAAYDYSNTAPGLIFISTNCGASWVATSAPSNRWYSVAASADGTKLIGGSRGLFTSTNSGTTWISNNIVWDFQNALPRWLSVGCSADGKTLVAIRDLSVYYSGSGPRSFFSTNYGATWGSSELTDVYGTTSVASSADGGRLMVSTSHLYLSNDSGTSWGQQIIPELPGPISEYQLGCVASSADGETMFLAVGGDEYGYPGTIFKREVQPHPRLNLAVSGSSLSLSWLAPSKDFLLQESGDLANWFVAPAAPTLNYTNLHYELRLPTQSTPRFYRLATQQ